MASGNTPKLVAMANQIAAFFATQPHADPAAEVAAHLRAYWDPRMREAIAAHLAAGGEGLSPLAREAVGRLHQPA
jgi:formate dehydrogenase subunit delta